DKPLDQFEGTTFKLISAPLPPEMSAYHWRATDGTLIVVVDPSISKEIFIETLFHEIQEDAWIRRGFDDHEAHVLASAEQIERFSKGQTELTPYHRAQISGMDADRLNALLDETDRTWHRDVLQRAGLQVPEAYENILR